MRNFLFEDTTTWFHFNEYKIETYQGEKVIMPLKIGEPDYYSPMDISKFQEKIPEAPYSYDNAYELPPTPQLALARLNVSDELEVLSFCNQWGLLGLWNEPLYQEAQELKPIGNKDIKGKNISEWFFSAHRRFSMKQNRREPLKLFQAAVREYQELLNRYFLIIKKKDTCNDIGKKLHTLKTYSDIEKELGPVTIRCGWLIEFYTFPLEFNKMLEGINIEFTWDENCKVNILWSFRSLLSAIYLQTMLTLQEGREFYKCQHPRCNRIFIRSRSDTLHCSERCGDAKRTFKIRQKQWSTSIVHNIKNKYENVDEKWLTEKVDDLLNKPGIGSVKAEKIIDDILKKQEV